MPGLHRSTAALALSLLTVLFCFGCTGSGASPRPAQPAEPSPPAMDDPEAFDQAAAFDRSLDRVLEREGGWQELRIETECLRGDAFERILIFGNGVAIWNGRRQVELEQDDLLAILESVRRAGLSSMLELYGRGQKGLEPPKEREPGEEGAVLRIICRVSVTLDGITEQAAQRARGPQFEPLQGLAYEILDLAHGGESGGITAADLDDGLSKVADGRLAPEAMTVLLNHKEEGVDPGTVAEPRSAGYLLRVDGRRLSVRPYRLPGGYGEPVEVELEAAAVADLAEMLTSSGVSDLPTNLYSVHYSDLVVEVLDRDVRIQARGFANMTRSTHGEKQERFEGIEEELDALARRVLSDRR